MKDRLQNCEEKFKTLFEASKFLLDVLEESIASEMKEQVLMLRQRMEEIKHAIQQWRQEASQQGKQGYQDLIGQLKSWLDRVDSLLKPRTVECKLADLRRHIQDMEVNC